ncbi:MAG: ABC transporter C-terminal domain-containing protein [Gemmatimonadota bacterium]
METIDMNGPAGGARRRSALAAVLALVFVLAARPPASASAQEPTAEQRIERLERQVRELRAALDATRDTTGLGEVRAQIEAITRELEELRLGADVVAAADTSLFGLGPGASKIYRVAQGVSIGGYGEVLYENFAREREDGADSGAADQLDFLRAIVYVGYKFDERFLFNSEIEFEHASTDQTGSVSVEFAYVDWLFAGAGSSLGARAGMVLVPMGFLNELHEPPTFLGTERPETESRIIPSTWRENGIGLFGDTGDFSWRAYLVNGLDAVGGGSSDAGGFSASGLRGGRQKGSRAVAENFAFVGRADWTGVLGLALGGSLYYGKSGQGNEDPLSPGGTVGAATFVGEAHAQYRARGIDLRGLYAVATVDDVESLNAARGLAGSASIGDRLTGWYVQAGYDVLRHAETDVQLLPYVRYERVNTQDEVPDGFSANPANDLTVVSIGAQVLPIPNLVLKADYQVRSNEADTGVNQFNVALGYLF